MKRFLLLFCTILVLLFSLPAIASVPVTAVTLNGTDSALNVRYIDENGNQAICPSAEYFSGGGTTTLNSGWYLASGKLEYPYPRGLTVSGNVHLILEDGCNLITYSIIVEGENSLTIYAQSTNTGTIGKLKVVGTDNRSAGIGGSEGCDGGIITINGGMITASGGSPMLTVVEYGAGIGGGKGGNGGIITINGGVVSATGGSEAAGIGGGQNGNGGIITINGGTVETYGGTRGAGIGGGYSGNGGMITISGGTVSAKTIANGILMGSFYGAGIGGGAEGNCGNILICGNDTNVSGSGINGAGIGGGQDANGGIVTIKSGTVEAYSMYGQALSGTTDTGGIILPATYTYWTNTVNSNPGGSGTNVPPDAPFNNNASIKYVKIIGLADPHDILLSPATDKYFGTATVGYSEQTPYSVTVNNTGNQPTGALAIALSGKNASSFSLNKSSISNIAVSGNDCFTIVPNIGLEAGTYSATVTVSGVNVPSRSFTVTQIVKSIEGEPPSENGGGCNAAAGYVMAMLLALPLLFRKK